jgi:VanZ family protein
MKRFLALWLPVVVWMGVIFAGSSISKVPQVGDETLDGLAHRVAHVLEFAALGALLLRATSNSKPVSKREIVITLIVIGLYGASDEFHQRFTPGRSSEGISVLFDVAGGAIGVWAWQRWARRARPREVTD